MKERPAGSPREPPDAGRVDRLVFAGWFVGSLAVLFWPSVPGPSLFPHVDLVVHFVLFAGLAWFGRRVGWGPVLLAVGLGGYAAGSEVVQALLLSDRSGTWLDLAADVAGSVAGLVLAGRTRTPWSRRS